MYADEHQTASLYSSANIHTHSYPRGTAALANKPTANGLADGGGVLGVGSEGGFSCANCSGAEVSGTARGAP